MLTILVAFFAVTAALFWYILYYRKFEGNFALFAACIPLALAMVALTLFPVNQYPDAISKNSNSSYTTNKFGVSTYSYRSIDSSINSYIVNTAWDSSRVAERMKQYGVVFVAQETAFGMLEGWDIQPIDSLQYDSLKQAGIRELH